MHNMLKNHIEQYAGFILEIQSKCSWNDGSPNLEKKGPKKSKKKHDSDDDDEDFKPEKKSKKSNNVKKLDDEDNFKPDKKGKGKEKQSEEDKD